ncbi:MAG: DUF3488 domain-containing protein [Deltaproteobacteria bacterium]|nr:DUF3488 domain-containing protein [Deltaproteobacteria bacterium]
MSALLRNEAAMAALRFVPPVAAIGVLGISAATTNLIGLAQGISGFFIAGSFASALLVSRNEIRVHLTSLVAMIAVAVAGLTRTGPPYMIASTLFVGLTLASWRLPAIGARMRRSSQGAAGASAASRASEPARRPLASGIAIGVGALVAVGLVITLPPLSRRVEYFVQRYSGDYIAGQESRIGFTGHIRIGGMTKMLQGDRVVLRIEGDRPEYLRGAVLDVYDRRVWSSSRAENRTELATNASLEAATTRIYFSRTAMSLPTDAPRWFLPLDACDVHTSSGIVLVDAHGTMEPTPPSDARMIGFRRPDRGACKAVLPPPAPPSRTDTSLADKIRAEVRPLAAKWAAGARTPKEAMDAYVRELAKFEYAIEDRREGRIDPVVDFLYNVHRGHCEHFASGLVLLARSTGIPARVVTGYRVSEENPVTGMAVVRERNAHSWVEAWIDDRWVTYDPTPFTEMALMRKPGLGQHATEALSWWWDRTIAFFQRLGLLGTGLFFGAAAVVLIVIRRFMQGRRKGHGDVVDAASRPLPAFEALSVALERVGLERAPSEPLERFARRVAAAETSWAEDVSRVIVMYAEHRYGGALEEEKVASELTRAARLAG